MKLYIWKCQYAGEDGYNNTLLTTDPVEALEYIAEKTSEIENAQDDNLYLLEIHEIDVPTSQE